MNNNNYQPDEYTKLKEDYNLNSKAGKHLLRAFRFAKSKLYQSASIEFNQACQLNKQEILPVAKKIFEEKVSEGDFEFALSVGTLLYSQDKSDYQLATNLANYARRVGNSTQAIGLFKQALALQPNYVVALCGLGATMEKIPYFDFEAINAFRSFNDGEWVIPDYIEPTKGTDYIFNPNYIRDISKDVVIYLKENQQKKIEKEEELEQDDYNKKSNQYIKRNIRSELINSNDIKNYLEQLMADNQELSKIINYNITILQIKNDFNITFLLERLEQIDETLPYLDILYGLYFVKIGDLSKAQNHFLDILKANKYNRYACVNLGLIYKKNGNLQQAARYLILSHYLLSRSYGKYQIELLVQMAHSKYESRNFREAISIFETLIIENHATPLEYLAYFNCLEKDKQSDKLYDELIKVKQRYPDNEDINIYINKNLSVIIDRGDKILKDNNPKQAIEFYQLALRLDSRIDIMRKIMSAYNKFELSDEESKQRDLIKNKLSEKLKKIETKDVNIISRQEKTERMRSEYLMRAKKYIQNGKYSVAILLVEKAFKMKNDRETFNILSVLYKKFNREVELASLEKQFKKINILENLKSKNKQ